jgi:hypothetical protein
MLAALAVVATLCALAQGPTRDELAADLRALRHGVPGEPAFDAAAPRLGALLDSRDAEFVAGAAYLIGEHRMSSYAPQLINALRHESEEAERSPTHVFVLLADALLQLEQPVPIELLFAKASSEHAGLLYFALTKTSVRRRDTDSLVRLLKLGLRSAPAHWAAAIELTRARDRRVVDELLCGEPWALCIDVHDPGEGMYVIPSCSVERLEPPVWPPRVRYRITLPDVDSKQTDIQFARYVFHCGCRIRTPAPTPRRRWRVRLLRELAPAVSPISKVDFDLELAFSSTDALGAALETHIAAVRARLEALVDALDAEGLVDDVLAAKEQLRLRVELRDGRNSVTPALPKPPDTSRVTFNVRLH